MVHSIFLVILFSANNYVDLYKIAKALKEEEHNYKFVALDTITALEEMALELAANVIKNPMGKKLARYRQRHSETC